MEGLSHGKQVFVVWIWWSQYVFALFLIRQVCETYPRDLYVPVTASKPIIVGSSKFRSKGRFPVLTYFYQEKKVHRWPPHCTVLVQSSTSTYTRIFIIIWSKYLSWCNTASDGKCQMSAIAALCLLMLLTLQVNWHVLSFLATGSSVPMQPAPLWVQCEMFRGWEYAAGHQ